MLGALVGVAATGLLVWQTAGVAMAAVLAFVVAAAAAAARLAFDSLVQRDNPDAVQGRAFARFESCFQLVWVVGALLPVLLAFSRPVGGLVVAFLTTGGAVAYGLELVAQRRARAAQQGGNAARLAVERGEPGGPATSPEPPPPSAEPRPPAPAAPPAAATTELPVASTVEVPLPPSPPDLR